MFVILIFPIVIRQTWRMDYVLFFRDVQYACVIKTRKSGAKVHKFYDLCNFLLDVLQKTCIL